MEIARTVENNYTAYTGLIRADQLVELELKPFFATKLDERHVENITTGLKDTIKKGKCLVPGVFTLFVHQEKKGMIDGNHRYSAFLRLSKETLINAGVIVNIYEWKKDVTVEDATQDQISLYKKLKCTLPYQELNLDQEKKIDSISNELKRTFYHPQIVLVQDEADQEHFSYGKFSLPLYLCDVKKVLEDNWNLVKNKTIEEIIFLFKKANDNVINDANVLKEFMSKHILLEEDDYEENYNMFKGLVKKTKFVLGITLDPFVQLLQ